MSSIPEPRDLEGFVEDMFMRITKEEEEAAIVKILEPLRRTIESLMEQYDEECQSWRDYRNDMWEVYIDNEENKEINKAIDLLLGNT